MLGAPSADFLSELVSIILINLVLSGDNAVVIGMAAAPLPGRQRRLALLLGGVVAIVLRVVLTFLAYYLLNVPALKVVGGLLLLWIAFDLLQQDEKQRGPGRENASFRGAVLAILVADVVMSLDNVLGVAAAAGGNQVLLIAGLILSMAIVIAGGGILASLIERVKWLAYLGAAVIAWTGVRLCLSDALVQDVVPVSETAQWVIGACVAVLIPVVSAAAHGRSAKSQPSA